MFEEKSEEHSLDQRSLTLSPKEMNIVQIVFQLLIENQYSQPITNSQLKKYVADTGLKQYLSKLNKAKILARGNIGEYWIGDSIRNIRFPEDMNMTEDKIEEALMKQREARSKQTLRLTPIRMRVVQAVIRLLEESNYQQPVTKVALKNALLDINDHTLLQYLSELVKQGILARGNIGEYWVGGKIREVSFPIEMELTDGKLEEILLRQRTGMQLFQQGKQINVSVEQLNFSEDSTSVPVRKASKKEKSILNSEDILRGIMRVMKQHGYYKPITCKTMQSYFSELGYGISVLRLKHLFKKFIDEGILEQGLASYRENRYWMGSEMVERASLLHDDEWDTSLLEEAWRRQQIGKNVEQTIQLSNDQWEFFNLFVEIYKGHGFEQAVNTQQLLEKVSHQPNNITKILSRLTDKQLIERVGLGHYIVGKKFGELDPEWLGVTLQEYREAIAKSEKLKESSTIKLTDDLSGLTQQLIRLNQHVDPLVQDKSTSFSELQSPLEEICKFPNVEIDEYTNRLLFSSLLRLQSIPLQSLSSSMQQWVRRCQLKLTSTYHPLMLSGEEMADTFRSLNRKGYSINPAAKVHYPIVERISQGLCMLEPNQQLATRCSMPEINYLNEATKLLNEHLDHLWIQNKRSNSPGFDSLQRFLDYLSRQISLQQHRSVLKQPMKTTHEPSLSSQRRALYRELIGTQIRLKIFEKQGLQLSEELIKQWFQPQLNSNTLKINEISDIQKQLASYYTFAQMDPILVAYQQKQRNQMDVLRPKQLVCKEETFEIN